ACQQARDIPNRRETDTDRSLREHNLTVYDTAASHAESLRRTRELGRGWVAAARSTSSPWCSYPIRWGQQIRVPGLQSNKTRDRAQPAPMASSTSGVLLLRAQPSLSPDLCHAEGKLQTRAGLAA